MSQSPPVIVATAITQGLNQQALKTATDFDAQANELSATSDGFAELLDLLIPKLSVETSHTSKHENLPNQFDMEIDGIAELSKELNKQQIKLTDTSEFQTDIVEPLATLLTDFTLLLPIDEAKFSNLTNLAVNQNTLNTAEHIVRHLAQVSEMPLAELKTLSKDELQQKFVDLFNQIKLFALPEKLQTLDVSSTQLISDGNKLPIFDLPAAKVTAFIDQLKQLVDQTKSPMEQAPISVVAKMLQGMDVKLKQKEESPLIAAIDTNKSSSFVQFQPISGTTQLQQHEPIQQLSLRQAGEATVPPADLSQRFTGVMKQQLMNMVNTGQGFAEIRLDPPELGSMIVRLQIHGEQTQVQFQVSQLQTKELIEYALPRLREMLQEQGIALADAQVSQDERQTSSSAKEELFESGTYKAFDTDDETYLDANELTASEHIEAIDFYA